MDTEVFTHLIAISITLAVTVNCIGPFFGTAGATGQTEVKGVEDDVLEKSNAC